MFTLYLGLNTTFGKAQYKKDLILFLLDIVAVGDK